MQLLVSVRAPGEVEAALEGEADIIDAKEPAHGAMGAVTPDRLQAIDERVPSYVPLSVALGDARSAVMVAAAITALPLRPRRAPVYLKLGLSEVSATNLRSVLAAGVEAARRHPAAPRLIAVEYADAGANLPSSDEVRDAAVAVGVAGILVDTATKDGRTLFAWWPESKLGAWIDGGRAAGLYVAVAGSLGAAELARIAAFGPDVVGVRGAACEGGRAGVVQAGRVRLLRAALTGESLGIANRKSPERRSGPHAHS